MRYTPLLLAGLLAAGAPEARAAFKMQEVPYHLAIVQDGRLLHETQHQSFCFRAEIVKDGEGVMPEDFRNGHSFIAAVQDERYSVRLYNPLPVRVGVNLTVDGLNSITGKPSGIADGEKWIIEPHGSVTIPGWQVSSGEARRFFFTAKPKSYAKWRGDMTGKDLAANCGVIGAAYFWNKEELDRYYDEHPVCRDSQNPVPYSGTGCKTEIRTESAPSAPAVADGRFSGPSPSAPSMQLGMNYAAPLPQAAQEPAGTGMGERESNPTYRIEFKYDAGMYTVAQAVVIYYDFEKAPNPNPFPGQEFSPEMN